MIDTETPVMVRLDQAMFEAGFHNDVDPRAVMPEQEIKTDRTGHPAVSAEFAAQWVPAQKQARQRWYDAQDRHRGWLKERAERSGEAFWAAYANGRERERQVRRSRGVVSEIRLTTPEVWEAARAASDEYDRKHPPLELLEWLKTREGREWA